MRYLIVVALCLSSCAALKHECAYNMGLCQKPSELMLVNGAKLHWDKSNLPVRLEYGPLGDKSIAAYTQAAKWINQQAGCQIFTAPQWTDQVGRVDLTCYNGIDTPAGLTQMNTWTGDNPNQNHRWETQNDDIGETLPMADQAGVIKTAKVEIPCATAFDSTQLIIATHELLHVLGFEHDRELNSLMYPYVSGAGMNLQDKDLRLLKNVYCGNDDFKNY